MSAQPVESARTVADQAVGLPAVIWRDVLAAVLTSCNRSHRNSELRGVLVEWDGTDLLLTSTDTYRLTRVRVPLVELGYSVDVTLGVPFRVLVPHQMVKGAHALVKGVKGAAQGEPWLLAFTGTLSFEGEWSHAGVSSSALDGVFPKVDGILDRDRLPNVPEGTDKLTVAFDPRFLADLCKMPREAGAPVALVIGDPVRPARADWNVGQVGYTHVLMPVRLAS